MQRHGGRVHSIAEWAERLRLTTKNCVPLLGLTLLATITAPALSEAQIADVDTLRRQHGLLAERLDNLDERVRIRVRAGLSDQLDAWRTGLEDLDGADYQRRLAQALETAGFYGLDTARLRALHDAARAILLRADFTVQPQFQDSATGSSLLSFMDWAGREEERAAERAAAAQAYKVELHRKLSLAFLEALLERDPATATTRFYAYAEALRTLASAEADALAAEAEALAAEQAFVRDLAASVPLLGEAMDIAGIAAGRDPITGEMLSALEWGIALVGVAGGPVTQLLRRIPAADAAINKLVALASGATSRLIETGRFTGEELAAFVARFGGGTRGLAEARAALRANLREAADAAMDSYRNSPAGRAAIAAWETAILKGQEIVDQAARRLGSGDVAPAVLQNDAAFLETYKAIRSDKRAIGALKDADPNTRNAIFDFEEHLFGRVVQRDGVAVNLGDGVVDKVAMRRVAEDLAANLGSGRAGDGVAAEAAARIETAVKLHAARTGGLSGDAAGAAKPFALETYLDPNDIRIEVFNATNTPPSRGAIGADRDITYRLILKDGTRLEVPSDLVRHHYTESLYLTLNPGTVPQLTPPGGKRPDAYAKALEDFAQKLDHTVTDGYHLDAYRPWYGTPASGAGGAAVDVAVFLDKGTDNLRRQVTEGGAEDIAGTIAAKGQHWFESAKDLIDNGNLERGYDHMAEGMRQLTKQDRNQILSRLQARGLDPAIYVPSGLAEAMAVLNRVTDPPPGVARLSPGEAEAAIKALGFRDLDDVAYRLGGFFEALEKSGLDLADAAGGAR